MIKEVDIEEVQSSWYKPARLLNVSYDSSNEEEGIDIENSVIFSCGCIPTGIISYSKYGNDCEPECHDQDAEKKLKSLNLESFDAVKIDVNHVHLTAGFLNYLLNYFRKYMVIHGCCDVLNELAKKIINGYSNCLFVSQNSEGSSSLISSLPKVLIYNHSSTGTEFNLFVNGNHTESYRCNSLVKRLDLLLCCIASSFAQAKTNYYQVADMVYQSLKRVVGITNVSKESGLSVNLYYNLKLSLFNPGCFMDYVFNHPKVKPQWEKYVNHSFVNQLGNSTLDIEAFKFFLRQDYKYLTHYARAASLMGYKAENIFTIVEAADLVKATKNEMKTHIEYCNSFGITLTELEATSEAIGTYAYSRFLTDIGSRNGWLDLIVATSPCLFGYGECIRRLLESDYVAENNVYWKWVETYSSPEFSIAAEAGRKLIEKYVLTASNEKIEELVDTFATATKLECNFWSQALNYKQFIE